MSVDTRAVVTAYFDCWKARNFDRLRTILADDVTYVGPLASITGADAYVRSMRGSSQSMTDLVVHKTFVDGDDAVTWFDLHTRGAYPTPVANWSHVENGKIWRVRVTFDPRGLLAVN